MNKEFFKFGKTNTIKRNRAKFDSAKKYITHITEIYPPSEAIQILDYYDCMVKNDIAFELRNKILYEGTFIDLNQHGFDPCLRFPYYDKEGNLNCTFDHCIEDIRIDFDRETTTFLLPWSQKKMERAILMSSNRKFQFDMNNHKAYYFYPFDFVYLYNGNHGIAAFSAKKNGFLMAKTINFMPIFPHVKTNGTEWISVYTNEILGEIQDFRIAVLFELQKTKSNLL